MQFSIVFLQREKNPGFTGKDLVGCSRIRVSQECAWQVNVTGEWSCGRTRCHSGRTPEGRTRYFELCPRRVDIVPFNKISSLSGDFNWFKHFRYIFKLDYWHVNAANLWQADIIWKPSSSNTNTATKVFWSRAIVFPSVTVLLCPSAAQMTPASSAGQQPPTQTQQMMGVGGMMGPHQGGPAPANATSYVMQQAAGYPTQ